VDEEIEKKRLRLFGEALIMLSGRHAFHNYTRRKLYIDNNDGRNPRRWREKRSLARYDEEDVESENGEGDIQLDFQDRPKVERVDFEVSSVASTSLKRSGVDTGTSEDGEGNRSVEVLELRF